MTARHLCLHKESLGFISTKTSCGLFLLKWRIRELTIAQWGKQAINTFTNMWCLYLRYFRTEKKNISNEPVLISFRNSTYCLKIKIVAEFVQHEPKLCYNERTVFTQRLLTSGDGQLVCPYLDFLKDENNELPQVQWYKVILYYIWPFTSLSNKTVCSHRQ